MNCSLCVFFPVPQTENLKSVIFSSEPEQEVKYSLESPAFYYSEPNEIQSRTTNPVFCGELPDNESLEAAMWLVDTQHGKHADWPAKQRLHL